MGYVTSVLTLIRWPNCILAALATLVGGYLQVDGPRQPDLILMATVIGLLCGAGNALNDRLDITGDRINHPERPLPQGDLTLTEASLTALILAGTGLMLCLFLTVEALLLAVLTMAALVWYDVRLKRVSIVGNAIVALLGAMAVIAGGVAAGGDIWQWPGTHFPALLAFLLHFAREMTKDIADIEGDRVVGFTTFPISRSPEVALNLASLAITLMVILTLAPMLYGWYGPAYAYIVVPAVDLPLLVILVALHTRSRPSTLRLANAAFKFGLLAGLAALFAGGALQRIS